MDPHRFDTVARDLTRARSRRGVLATMLGSVLGLLRLAETEAKHKKHKKKHQSPVSPPPGSPPSPPPPPCVPQDPVALCADGCGTRTNNCGQTVVCGATCAAGTVCSAGHCVNGSLAVGATCDPVLSRACSSGVC